MDAAPPPTEPGVTITLPWLATQLIPSPELAYGNDEKHGKEKRAEVHGEPFTLVNA